MVAPLAVSMLEPPGQTLDVAGVTVKLKVPFMFTVAVATPVQVPLAPNTVYVVAVTGLAVTTEPLGELNVPDGDQV